MYLAGRDPFLHWGLARRRREEMGTESITVAPMEYVIVMKLRYFRDGGAERHLRDIERMLEISGSRLDHRALQPWIETYQLESEWAAGRRRVRKCVTAEGHSRGAQPGSELETRSGSKVRWASRARKGGRDPA